MEFNDYQLEASQTIQKNSSSGELAEIVPFLGIIGEIGSVVTQLKTKLRDGNSYVAYKPKLSEELGDVLWYAAAIATQNGLNLEDIANDNLKKVKDRFIEDHSSEFIDFDLKYPINEQFPEEFEIEFVSYIDERRKMVKLIDKRDNKQLGDPLTDNTYDDDGYRFHDIFHFGYLAILGWSPVLRKLFNIKRKSDPEIDENEDGARSWITEELISLYIYHHVFDHDLLKYASTVDSSIIKEVQNLVKNTELKEYKGKQWEKAILTSYDIFNTLRENDGGRVLVSKKNRNLIYLGKK